MLYTRKRNKKDTTNSEKQLETPKQKRNNEQRENSFTHEKKTKNKQRTA